MRFIHVFFLFLIICFNSNANDEPRSGAFLVSHVDYKRVTNFYLPIIKQAYLDIGIEAEFVSVGTARGLMLVEQGLVDADLIRLQSMIDDSENTIEVTPPIATANLDLFCWWDRPCDLSVLTDPSNAIAFFAAQRKLIEKRYTFISAKKYFLENPEQIVAMMRKHRLDYAFLPSDDYVRNTFKDFHYFNIGLEPVSHVLNKKHKKLAESLGKAIEKRMKEAKALQKKNLEAEKKPVTFY